MTAPADQGRILVVCTGNVCRSPYLERVLRRELVGTGIGVESAGTGALVDRPMDPSSLALLAAEGIDGADFRARALTEAMVRDADLVLAASRDHVDRAVRFHPRALRYSFALGDLADLVADVPTERLLAAPGSTAVARVAATAVSLRGTVQPRTPAEAMVVDPYGQGPSVFDRMARQIGTDLPAVVSALRRSAGA